MDKAQSTVHQLPTVYAHPDIEQKLLELGNLLSPLFRFIYFILFVVVVVVSFLRLFLFSLRGQ